MKKLTLAFVLLTACLTLAAADSAATRCRPSSIEGVAMSGIKG